MPRNNPKLLANATPGIQQAIATARANPGQLVIVNSRLLLTEAANLCGRLRAVRKGLALHESPGSELHQMGDARVLHFYNKPDPNYAYLRQVSLLYTGHVRPPSDLNRQELLKALGFPTESIY